MMEHSESLSKLAPALVAAQAEMPTAPRKGLNPHFKSRYADLTTLWDTCRATLAKHGLCVVQTFHPFAERPGPDSIVCMMTTLLHTSGEWIRGTLDMPAGKATPHAVGSAITYARRYSLAAILGMVSDDDDDAEAAMGRGNGKTATAPAATPNSTVEDVI